MTTFYGFRGEDYLNSDWPNVQRRTSAGPMGIPVRFNPQTVGQPELELLHLNGRRFNARLGGDTRFGRSGYVVEVEDYVQAAPTGRTRTVPIEDCVLPEWSHGYRTKDVNGEEFWLAENWDSSG